MAEELVMGGGRLGFLNHWDPFWGKGDLLKDRLVASDLERDQYPGREIC